MSKVLDFLLKIPYLCGSTNPERWSKIIELQYYDELKNSNSVFKLNDIDKDFPMNRAETVFGFMGDPGKIDHCKMLVELLLLNHYINYHNETRYIGRKEEVTFFALETERLYPEIANTLTVNEANTESFWDD